MNVLVTGGTGFIGGCLCRSSSEKDTPCGPSYATPHAPAG